MAKTKTNSAGVDVSTGKIMEHGYFPKGALKQLSKAPEKSTKKPSPVTKKGKK